MLKYWAVFLLQNILTHLDNVIRRDTQKETVISSMMQLT